MGENLDARSCGEVAGDPGVEPVAVGAAVWAGPLVGAGMIMLGDGLPGKAAQPLGVSAGAGVPDKLQHPFALDQGHDGVGGAVVLVETAVVLGVLDDVAQASATVVGEAGFA